MHKKNIINREKVLKARLNAGFFVAYDSIIIKLLNIGESAFNLSEELKNKFPDVDWWGMYKIRNIIPHSYHNVDENIIWDIVKNELPQDKSEIIRIIKYLNQ